MTMVTMTNGESKGPCDEQMSKASGSGRYVLAMHASSPMENNQALGQLPNVKDSDEHSTREHFGRRTEKVGYPGAATPASEITSRNSRHLLYTDFPLLQ